MSDLEKQYEEYIPLENIGETILDGTYLELNIEDIQIELARTSKKLYRELIKNSAVQKASSLVGRVIGVNLVEEPLDEDASLIVELLTHIVDTQELLDEVKNAVTDQNFQSLAKLVDFIVEKYLESFNNLQLRRKSIEAFTNSVTFIDNTSEDSKDKLKEFVRVKLNELTGGKHLEKKN